MPNLSFLVQTVRWRNKYHIIKIWGQSSLRKVFTFSFYFWLSFVFIDLEYTILNWVKALLKGSGSYRALKWSKLLFLNKSMTVRAVPIPVVLRVLGVSTRKTKAISNYPFKVLGYCQYKQKMAYTFDQTVVKESLFIIWRVSAEIS